MPKPIGILGCLALSACATLAVGAADGGTGGSSFCAVTEDAGSDARILGLQSGSPWPMYQAGPSLNGRAAAAGPAQPTAKWFVPGDFGQPSIAADGTVYAVNGGVLEAIHPDGTLGWSLNPLKADAGEAFNGPPAIRADGSLVIGSRFNGDGGLYAIASSGCVEWVTPLADAPFSPPTIASNGAIYLTTNHEMRAFSADGGAVWATTINTAETYGAGTPAIGPDGTIYAGGAGTGLSAFNSAGVAQWTTTGYQASLGDDGTIYVVGESTLRALAPSGAQLWNLSFSSDLAGTPPVSAGDGTLFVEAETLVAVNATGVEKWNASLYEGNDNLFWPPVVGGDGTVYVGTTDIVIATCFPGCTSNCACGPITLGDGLQAILPDGGTAWVFGPNAAFASPAIGADGTLYVAASWTSFDAGMPLAPPDTFGGLYALGEAP